MTSREYYSALFPCASVHEFATIGAEPERVEFSIEAVDAAGDDYRRRHVACKTPDDLRRLVTANDVRAVHVGGIYPDDVQRSRGRPDQKARRKLLVFDIDLQDYDFLAASATDQAKNDRMWALVAGGLCILRELLSSKFGFKCFLPVYSGRRGAHLWVLDARAIDASDAARDAICCNVTPPPAKGDPVPRFATVLAGLDAQVLRVADSVWKEIAILRRTRGGLGLLDTDQIGAFLDKLFYVQPDKPRVKAAMERLRRDAERMLSNHSAPDDKDAALVRFVSGHGALEPRLRDLKLACVWPRLDAAASRSCEHTTKLPFSAHRKTGRVSMPFVLKCERQRPPILSTQALFEDDRPRATLAAAVKLLEDATAEAKRLTGAKRKHNASACAGS